MLAPFVFSLAALLITSASVAHAARLTIEASPVGPTAEELERSTALALKTPRARAALKGIVYRVIASEIGLPGDKDTGTEELKYAVQIYDYTHDRLLTISGNMSEVESRSVSRDEVQPLPTHDEFLHAIEILRKDPMLGTALRSGELDPYEAMPPMLDLPSSPGQRVIPVGLRPTGRRATHEIVAVNLSQGHVERFTLHSPPESVATGRACGPPTARQGSPKKGTPGAADLVIGRGGQVLWKLRVVRPAASSAFWGSGVELLNVSYKGAPVLARAHAPVLNVNYDGNVCGPFRDPVNLESAFNAKGRKLASGILQASELPSTIFDTKNDKGNYWGVAIYEQGDEVIIMSELLAGWYRYVSEWRLHDDGRIRPLFKFDAVHNSCTCKSHYHHVYWRFDFDPGDGKRNSAQVKEELGWRTITKEEQHTRDKNHQAWRVYNSDTLVGYEITPGPYDQPTNAFGKADAWIMRFNKNENDDSRLLKRKDKDAKIGAFINGESVENTDLVFWYSGHIGHAEGDEAPHIAGPTLTPWIGNP